MIHIHFDRMDREWLLPGNSTQLTKMALRMYRAYTADSYTQDFITIYPH